MAEPSTDAASGNNSNHFKNTAGAIGRIRALKKVPKVTAADDYDQEAMAARRKRMLAEFQEDGEGDDDDGGGTGRHVLNKFELISRGKVGWYRKVFTSFHEEPAAFLSASEVADGLSLALGHPRQELVPHIPAVLEEIAGVQLLDFSASRVDEATFLLLAALSESEKRMPAAFRRLTEPRRAGDHHDAHFAHTGRKLLRRVKRIKDLFAMCDGIDGYNTVSLDDLSTQMNAGGLSLALEVDLARDFATLGKGYITFMDFVYYLPLFSMLHSDIVLNPLERRASDTTLMRNGSVVFSADNTAEKNWQNAACRAAEPKLLGVARGALRGTVPPTDVKGSTPQREQPRRSMGAGPFLNVPESTSRRGSAAIETVTRRASFLVDTVMGNAMVRRGSSIVADVTRRTSTIIESVVAGASLVAETMSHGASLVVGAARRASAWEV